MEDELKIVLKSEDALRLDMQEQQPLELLLNNPVTYTGTTNYNELGNKPSINSVTLQGNKTASDLNLVHRGGDAMSGVLFVPNLVTKWGVEFQNQSQTLTGGMYQDTANNNNQVYFDEYTGAGKRECYLLPSPTATETTFHNILTDKYAVTIAQGGTGATSASDAAENLGVVKKSGDTMTGYLKLPRAQLQDGDYPRITFLDSSTSTDVGSIISHNAQRRTLVRQVSSNGSEETFQFPSSLSATSNAYYDVITSKGGTMTGTLNVPTTRIYDASNPMLSFVSSASDSSALAAVYSQIANRNMVLRTRGTAGYVEDYMLPNNTATGTHKNYEIFNSKDGVLAYKDQTVSISLSANTWTEMTVTQQVAPTGYTPLTRTIADGSTTAIRGYLFLAPNNMGNTAHILLYSTQAVTGTFTLRTWFVKSSAAIAL